MTEKGQSVDTIKICKISHPQTLPPVCFLLLEENTTQTMMNRKISLQNTKQITKDRTTGSYSTPEVN